MNLYAQVCFGFKIFDRILPWKEVKTSLLIILHSSKLRHSVL